MFLAYDYSGVTQTYNIAALASISSSKQPNVY